MFGRAKGQTAPFFSPIIRAGMRGGGAAWRSAETGQSSRHIGGAYSSRESACRHNYSPTRFHMTAWQMYQARQRRGPDPYLRIGPGIGFERL